MAPAICVENLSKVYRINHAVPRGAASDRTIRETISDAMAAPWRRWTGSGSVSRIEDFWALHTSFTVQPGEVVGIVGRNGAGKSTLLKILTRITEPTGGRVRIRGRIGSLLEVGTGFHPELTGRENIFLNGTILGMKREDIRRCFDAIVDFSGVEKFLDVPVKRYSSGMKVRLAFSVAATFSPEILVIDEVLAVGDADFRRKCLSKMGEAARSGRTVLFVSHTMSAVRKLCDRALLLQDGRLEMDGEPDEVIEAYLGTDLPVLAGASADLTKWKREERHLGSSLEFRQCQILNSENQRTEHLKFGEPFSIEISGVARKQIDQAALVVGIESGENVRIVSATSEDMGIAYDFAPGEPFCIRTTFEHFPLTPARYDVTLGMRSGKQVFDRVAGCMSFEVLHTPIDGVRLTSRMHGFLRPMQRWERDDHSLAQAS